MAYGGAEEYRAEKCRNRTTIVGNNGSLSKHRPHHLVAVEMWRVVGGSRYLHKGLVDLDVLFFQNIFLIVPRFRRRPRYGYPLKESTE